MHLLIDSLRLRLMSARVHPIHRSCCPAVRDSCTSELSASKIERSLNVKAPNAKKHSKEAFSAESIACEGGNAAIVIVVEKEHRAIANSGQRLMEAVECSLAES